jgi:hypothetical protein
MKRNTATIIVTSVSGLFIVLFLLVNLTDPVSMAPSVPVKKEISIDIVIEKKKVRIPKPKVKVLSKPKPKPIKQKIIKAKIKKRKAPSSSTLQKKEILNGALPPISANYREHLGFRRYASAMHARGARFYILGGSKKQIYQINLSSRSLRKVSAADIISKNFSPRTRVIEDEPALQFFLNKAKNDFQIAAPRVILLVPQQMEQNIAARLVQNGVNLNKFSGFRGTYLMSSGNFTLKIQEGVSSSGRKSMNVAIPL